MMYVYVIYIYMLDDVYDVCIYVLCVYMFYVMCIQNFQKG